MRKSIDFNVEKTSCIGEFVNRDYFNHYTETFTDHFSASISFGVDKTLIKNILNQSDQVKGIRFMWGLTDYLNINSAKLFLVPCSSSNETGSPIFSLLFNHGYHDTKGNLHSVEETCRMISYFIISAKRIKNSLPYKTITRAAFFGKESLISYMDDLSEDNFEIHLGYDVNEKLIIPIFTSGDNINGPFMNAGCPCPPICCEEGGEGCIASLSVNRNADDAELDLFRAFRDQHLLDLPNGSTYYEMYYFLTPIVNSMISKSDNKEMFLDHLYTKKIKPFGDLLKEGKHLQALDILSEILFEWSNKYAIETV